MTFLILSPELYGAEGRSRRFGKGWEARLPLETPGIVKQVEEGCLHGAKELCWSHAALSDGAFALSIENA